MITLPCLTLWPEWAFAVAWLGKDVENRTWSPPARLIGQRIGIHAGARMPTRRSLHDVLEVANAACPAPLGARAVWPSRDRRELNFFWRPTDRGSLVLHTRPIVRSAIVATAVVVEARRDSPSPWAIEGLVHWCLADVRRLDEPVPAKGRQGLWSITLEAT